MKRYIVYLRCSTKRQGDSGLGLDAQRMQVSEFVRSRGAEILQEYIEVESGTVDDRPQLEAALAASKLYQAPLLIAKLDRLSRSAAFLMKLQESDVEFTCADMPDCCSMTIGVMALVARQERDAISTRTKAALAQAKARGTHLGGRRKGQKPPTDDARLRGHDKLKAQAVERAARYRHPLEQAARAGCKTPADVARYFNEQKIPTINGKTGTWQNIQADRLLKRLGLNMQDLLKEVLA